MRNTNKNLVSITVATVLASGALFVSTAQAGSGVEVSGSAAVSNMYLWRGYDLGDGNAAVSGDLSVSSGSGLYGGIWGSSGDATLGNEYDLYAGWGKEFDNGASFDASVWTYAYPDSDIDPGELVDLVVSVGYGPVTGTLYEMIEGDDESEYRYYTLGYEQGKFSALYGQHDNEVGDDPGHVQLGYQYNDNLSFAVSQFVVDNDGVDDDPQFQVTYSLDIQ